MDFGGSGRLCLIIKILCTKGSDWPGLSCLQLWWPWEVNFLGHLTDPPPFDLDYRVGLGKGFVPP